MFTTTQFSGYVTCLCDVGGNSSVTRCNAGGGWVYRSAQINVTKVRAPMLLPLRGGGGVQCYYRYEAVGVSNVITVTRRWGCPMLLPLRGGGGVQCYYRYEAVGVSNVITVTRRWGCPISRKNFTELLNGLPLVFYCRCDLQLLRGEDCDVLRLPQSLHLRPCHSWYCRGDMLGFIRHQPGEPCLFLPTFSLPSTIEAFCSSVYSFA